MLKYSFNYRTKRKTRQREMNDHVELNNILLNDTIDWNFLGTFVHTHEENA